MKHDSKAFRDAFDKVLPETEKAIQQFLSPNKRLHFHSMDGGEPNPDAGDTLVQSKYTKGC